MKYLFLLVLSLLFVSNMAIAQRPSPPSWTSTESDIKAWEDARGTQLERTEEDGVVRVDYESAFSWGYKPKGLRSYFFEKDQLVKIVFLHKEDTDEEGIRPKEALDEYKKALKMEGAYRKSEEEDEEGYYTSTWKSRTKRITLTRTMGKKGKTFEIVRTYEPLY